MLMRRLPTQGVPLSIHLLIAWMVVFASTAFAQNVAVAQPPSRVNLGSTAGAPGTRLTVPIYFNPAPGVVAGKLFLSVRYVSNSLRFEKIEPGLDAELNGIEFQSKATEGKNDKDLNEQTVVITAAAGAKGKPIPSGLLGYISYAISEEGKAATITLRTTAEASEMASGAKLVNLRAFDAEVEVQLPGDPPAIICFFFTH